MSERATAIPSARPVDEPRPVLRWLAWLRWVSVIGQLAALAVASAFAEVELHLPYLLGLVGLGALSNLALHVNIARVFGRRSPWRLILAILIFDVVLLTGLLLASGGPANPFSVFYLVHVVLAGFVLGALGAWSMAGVTIVAFGLLFILPATPIDHHAAHHGTSSLHLQGMWVAYVLAACFLATFVSGLSRALSRRDHELIRLRERNARSERLAALATLSASAAHELGSPLTTIAVTARELEIQLSRSDMESKRDGLVADARLIRDEVERCRGLLHDISRRGGLLTGERLEVIAPLALWNEVLSRSSRRPGLEVQVDPTPAPALEVPRAGMLQALMNLVENAHDAHIRAKVSRPIRVGTTALDGVVRLWVRDEGTGFSADILAELGQAFVTSRPGEGLGLGLHLASRLARELGGRLEVSSSSSGSQVFIELPISKASEVQRG